MPASLHRRSFRRPGRHDRNTAGPLRVPGAGVRQNALIGVLAVLIAGSLGGCLSDGETRLDALGRIVNWEDQRLAPGDSLDAMLAHPDAHVRLAAVRAAGLIGSNDARTGLVAALDDRSRTVRVEAVWALGLLNDFEALPHLIQATEDRHPLLRRAALSALAHLDNDGSALLAAAGRADPLEAALAWNGLRNQVDRVDSTALVNAIQSGLTRPESDVRWRVLRCAERRADPSLTPVVQSFARSSVTQERIHAYRALSRIGGAEALRIVQDGFAHHDDFRGHNRARVLIAGFRALGTLAAPLAAAPDTLPDANSRLEQVCALLTTGAGHEDPHVAETALAAMAQLVADAPLPPEAAQQESLLPVWRIRLARVAEGHLDHAEPAVRAVAVTARGALRGAGALKELRARFRTEDSPFAAAALITAVGALQSAPWDLQPFPSLPACPASELLTAARLEAHVARTDDLGAEVVRDRLVDAARLTASPVGRATALAHLGAFPDSSTAAALLGVADEPAGPWRSDMVLAALGSLPDVFTATDSSWSADDTLRAAAAAFLRRAFDDPDLRIRLAARAAATATTLLPVQLIPGEPSLRATLPAVARPDDQPPLARSFDAGRVRCVTARGEFEIVLDGQTAPNTCAMFRDRVERGLYDDLVFHRVVPDFVAQGGDPTGTGWGGPGYTLRSEWSRTPYRRGTVGIAHSGKDTGGCQFFVTLSAQPHLNGRYTVFGEVRKGMDVVDRLCVGDTMRFELMP